MVSAQDRGRRRVLLAGCTLLVGIAWLMAVGTPGRALAQGGAPGPGWIQVPGGGWVPPGHPLAGTVPPPSAGPCGLHTLRGSYIFAASGYNIVAGVAQPKAIVEPIDFHGDGTLSVPAVTVSINGNIMQGLPGVGVYTVGDGCRGTVTFSAPPNLPAPSYDIFFDHTGKQAWMIQTNPGTVFQGTATRIQP